VADNVTFRRKKPKSGYTKIDNRLFNDDRLKADEQGVMGYLISRPDDWSVQRFHLMKKYDMGEERMQRIMWNLTAYEWFGVRRYRRDDGTIATEIEIREEPGPEMTVDEAKALYRAMPRKNEPLGTQPLAAEPLGANPAGASIIIKELEITEPQTPNSPPEGGGAGDCSPVLDQNPDPATIALAEPASAPEASSSTPEVADQPVETVAAEPVAHRQLVGRPSRRQRQALVEATKASMTFKALVGKWLPAHCQSRHKCAEIFAGMPETDREKAVDRAAPYVASRAGAKLCDLPA
jgi:hypothetical protein